MNARVSELNATAVQRTRENDLDGAIEACNEAIGIDPENFESYFNRGMANKMARNFDNAINDFTSAIANFPPSLGPVRFALLAYLRASAIHDKAEAKRDVDLVRKAIEDYEQVLKLDPTHNSTMQNLAVARRQLSGQW